MTLDRPARASKTRPAKTANTGRSKEVAVVAPKASGNDKHKYWTDKQQDACVAKVRAALGKNVVNNVTVGKLLTDAQNNVDPGTWGVFVSQNLRWERRAVEKFQSIYAHPVIAKVLDNTDEGKEIAAALPDAWTSLAILATVGFDRAEKVQGRSYRLFKDDGKALLSMIREGRVYQHMVRSDCQALADEDAGREPKPTSSQPRATGTAREQELEAQVADLTETLTRVTTQVEQDAPKALPSGVQADVQQFFTDNLAPLFNEVVTFDDLEAALSEALSRVQAKTGSLVTA